MFEKLVSSLPFNPGIVQQLAFYAKRLRQEQGVRRIGLVFLVLAFVIQFFAFINPPQSTEASSSNDLVNGGFVNAANPAAYAASVCQQNINSYGTILAYYGITCAKVASAPTLTLQSNAVDPHGNVLWSMGWNQQSMTQFPDQEPVSIPGIANTLYIRHLHDWDSGAYSTYQALNVTSIGGQTFFLLFTCGNLVSFGPPQPVKQPPPSLNITKTTIPGFVAANSTVPPGTTLGFRVYFNNTSPTAATNVYVSDPQPANTTETWMGTSAATSNYFTHGIANWYYTRMPGDTSNWYADVEFKVNSNTPNGTKICNVASIKSTETTSINSNNVCFTVKVTAKKPPVTPPPPPPPPKSTCEQLVTSTNKFPCVKGLKTAANLTENISNANGTTAKAGDEILYTLYATNKGPDTAKGYVFKDGLAYVLDYSTLINKGGGSIDSKDNIVYPAVNIAPGKTAKEQFEVKVDDPIPQTPASSSDSTLFNLTMTNTFFNTITIKLPQTVVSAVQTTTTTTLPNTGPGSSIGIAAAVVAVAGFFYYRSRLLAKEAKIAIIDQSGGQ